MFLDENIALRVKAKLDGIDVDEYIIVERGTPPDDVIMQLTEAYDLSNVARNRLFELVNPQLACDTCEIPPLKEISINVAVKGLRLRHRVLFDAYEASPYDLADRLIVDHGLARNMEDYWLWSKMIVFSVLWAFEHSIPEVEMSGIEIVKE